MADAHADEAEGGVADGGGHAADLAVFAFGEGEAEPGVGHVFAEAHGRVAGREIGGDVEERDVAGRGAVVAEGEAAAGELGEGGGSGDAFDEGGVFALVGVVGIEEAGVEAGLVAEEKEAFGIGVEAAEGVDVRRQVEIGEGAPAGAGLGRELG